MGPVPSARPCGRAFDRGNLHFLSAAFLAVILPVGAASVARAAGQADLLREQLATGEFGPALELARNESAVERDNSLAEIAKAQAQAEARAAAYNTVAEITDGRVRRRVLDEMAAMPVEADGRGGGSMAQWGPLMNLITNTIQPDSWDDNGGPGSMQPFANGVYVDAAGVMPRVKQVEDTDFLAEARRAAMHDMVSDDVAALRRCARCRCRGWNARSRFVGPPASRSTKTCWCWPG